MDIETIFSATPALEQAFRECSVCMQDVYSRAKIFAHTSPGTPHEFEVTCGGLPLALLSVRRNLFSSLFQAAYGLLTLSKARRLLYGKINYLFRIWVTAADNLLDEEDKVVLDLRLSGSSHVMRQVIALMTADRILHDILEEAVINQELNLSDARYISQATLQVLLPSAAEEASEEKGITRRPKPEYVLKTVHPIKTGLLFLVPLLGPEHLEKGVDRGKLDRCRSGLSDFGIGCQLLDDVRDIARDHLEQRHNYVLSLIAQEGSQRSRLKSLLQDVPVGQKVFREFPGPSSVTVRLADRYLRNGLFKLDQAGLGLGPERGEALVQYMFKALDVSQARVWLKT